MGTTSKTMMQLLIQRKLGIKDTLFLKWEETKKKLVNKFSFVNTLMIIIVYYRTGKMLKFVALIKSFTSKGIDETNH